jgi:pimeloyl-ACP methyl ester carboxylesterase
VLKRIGGLLCALSAAACLTAAEPVEGDWIGTLKPGMGVELRLIVHIKAEAGKLTGTMDSIDQGAKGIPIDSITFSDGKLVFTMNAIQGKYEGTFDAEKKRIAGTWTQAGNSNPLDLEPYVAPKKTSSGAVEPSDIDGEWQGTLDAGMQQLRLLLKLKMEEDGLTATMVSVDQGGASFPASTVKRSGDSLELTFNAVGGTYKATIDAARKSMKGTWSQGGNELPLELKRLAPGEKPAAELKRPQNPVKPYPYEEREVAFDNPKAAGVKLAGTLTVPRGAGPFPALALVTGSGPQDRDESLLNHKPFLVLADHLTRAGIAVLRYDDRGFGKSTGNFAAATTVDFASDAEAAFDFLSKQPGIDPKRVGLGGHSEGGVVTPIVAARRPEVAFLVLIAPTAVPGYKVLEGQLDAIAKVIGKPQSAESRELSLAVFAAVNRGATTEELRPLLRKAVLAGEPKASEQMIDARMKQIDTPWFRYFIGYDPANTLEKVKTPTLVLFGEKDLQVLPSDNLNPLKSAFSRAGNTRVRVEVLPGLNHLMQTAGTGSPTEYGRIEETMSPTALRLMSNWILEAAKPSN